MARVKRGVTAHARHKKVLKAAKGYRGRNSTVFRVAIEKLRSSPLDEPQHLAAYLRGVALNLWIAHQRKAARRATMNRLTHGV